MKTGPKDPRSTTLSESEEAMVVAFRRHTLLPLEDCLTNRYVSHVLDLAFLTPSVVGAILAGTQPQRLTAKALMLGGDLPLHWQQQREMLAHGP
jgi:hypothetical protein